MLFCFSVDGHRHLRLCQKLVIIKVCRFEHFGQNSSFVLSQLDIIFKLLEAVNLSDFCRVICQQGVSVPELDVLDDRDVEEEDDTDGDDDDMNLVSVLGLTLEAE